MSRMKKLVQVPRFREINPVLVMNYVFDEITPGFRHWGFEVRVVMHKEDLEDGGILFFDDNVYKHNRPLIDDIAKQCPNSVCICWYWLDTSYKPFKYMIHTGENNLFPPSDPSDRHRFFTYMKVPTYVPIVYRPNEEPDKIGTYTRNDVRDYCYMGANYRPDLVPSSPEFTGIYHTGHWKDYLSYDQRREIYLSTTFALGFHNPPSIECGSISARIYEGLIYGCVVFCESEYVCNSTDNIVVYTPTKEDIENKIRFYKEHPEFIKEKQMQAYKFMKEKAGTNIHSCILFIQKIKEIYGLDFLE